jgi:hypothetical protein
LHIRKARRGTPATYNSLADLAPGWLRILPEWMDDSSNQR